MPNAHEVKIKYVDNGYSQYGWRPGKYWNSTQAPGEWCAKRVEMPATWINPANIIDEYPDP